MRIEIYDSVMGISHDRQQEPPADRRLVRRAAALLMSADARMLTQIRIWPEDEEEIRLLGTNQQVAVRFTQDGLLYLAEKILEA